MTRKGGTLMEKQFIVPSLKKQLEAIEKIDDPALKAILQRHLPSDGEATLKSISLTKKKLRDAELHEFNLLKGVSPEDS